VPPLYQNDDWERIAGGEGGADYALFRSKYERSPICMRKLDWAFHPLKLEADFRRATQFQFEAAKQIGFGIAPITLSKRDPATKHLYYTTDGFDGDLTSFAGADGRSIPVGTLAAWLLAITNTLVAVKGGFRRGHGDLRPSRVLVRCQTESDLGSVQVALTEFMPLKVGTAPQVPFETKDVEFLGEMICRIGLRDWAWKARNIRKIPVYRSAKELWEQWPGFSKDKSAAKWAEQACRMLGLDQRPRLTIEDVQQWLRPLAIGNPEPYRAPSELLDEMECHVRELVERVSQAPRQRLPLDDSTNTVSVPTPSAETEPTLPLPSAQDGVQGAAEPPPYSPLESPNGVSTPPEDLEAVVPARPPAAPPTPDIQSGNPPPDLQPHLDEAPAERHDEEATISTETILKEDDSGDQKRPRRWVFLVLGCLLLVTMAGLAWRFWPEKRFEAPLAELENLLKSDRLDVAMNFVRTNPSPVLLPYSNFLYAVSMPQNSGILTLSPSSLTLLQGTKTNFQASIRFDNSLDLLNRLQWSITVSSDTNSFRISGNQEATNSSKALEVQALDNAVFGRKELVIVATFPLGRTLTKSLFVSVAKDSREEYRAIARKAANDGNFCDAFTNYAKAEGLLDDSDRRWVESATKTPSPGVGLGTIEFASIEKEELQSRIADKMQESGNLSRNWTVTIKEFNKPQGLGKVTYNFTASDGCCITDFDGNAEVEWIPNDVIRRFTELELTLKRPRQKLSEDLVTHFRDIFDKTHRLDEDSMARFRGYEMVFTNRPSIAVSTLGTNSVIAGTVVTNIVDITTNWIDGSDVNSTVSGAFLVKSGRKISLKEILPENQSNRKFLLRTDNTMVGAGEIKIEYSDPRFTNAIPALAALSILSNRPPAITITPPPREIDEGAEAVSIDVKIDDTDLEKVSASLVRDNSPVDALEMNQIRDQPGGYKISVLGSLLKSGDSVSIAATDKLNPQIEKQWGPIRIRPAEPFKSLGLGFLEFSVASPGLESPDKAWIKSVAGDRKVWIQKDLLQKDQAAKLQVDFGARSPEGYLVLGLNEIEGMRGRLNALSDGDKRFEIQLARAGGSSLILRSEKDLVKSNSSPDDVRPEWNEMQDGEVLRAGIFGARRGLLSTKNPLMAPQNYWSIPDPTTLGSRTNGFVRLMVLEK